MHSPHNVCESVMGEGHMVQASEYAQEYEINFKESYVDRLPPSCDEGDVPGLLTYDPLLNSAKGDALSVQQEPLHAVSVRYTDTAMLGRGSSASIGMPERRYRHQSVTLQQQLLWQVN